MALTAVAEIFKAGKNTALTFGTVTGLDVMDGSIKEESAVDEMTGTASQGYYADVDTIKKASGTFKIAYRVSLSFPVEVGKVYHMIADNDTNGDYFSGDVRVVSRDTPMFSVKNGIVQTFSFTSQGPYTKTRPVTP